MSKAPYIEFYGLYLARKFAEAEGFTLDFIQGRIRHQAATRARAAVIWRLAKETELSLPEIGAVVKKDHTSILHSIRAENERRGETVRGMVFPPGYWDRRRNSSNLYNMLNREVMA